MVMFRFHRFPAGFVYRVAGMFGGRVNRIDFQGFVSGVDDVVPFAGGNEDGVVVRDRPHEIEFVGCISHHDIRPALFDAQELVEAVVPLQTDILAGGNGHQRDLQVVARPERRAEVVVRERVGFDVQHGRSRAVILQDNRCVRCVVLLRGRVRAAAGCQSHDQEQ